MADSTPGKNCRVCGEWKPLDEYHKQSRAKDGHQSRCKDCAKRLAKQWYEANKDRALESQKRRREADPESYRDYLRDYYRANREKWETPEAREASRKRARAFLERVKAGDPEAIALKKRKDARYYARHRDEIIATTRAYAESRKDDPDWRLARQERVRRRRAKKRNAGVCVVTPKDLQRLILRHLGLCAYCRSRPWEHLDHVIPISRGGRHAIGNLLPACAACNLSKGNRLLIEWRRYRADIRAA